MKLLSSCLILFALTTSVSAAPCVTGTLHAYVALGASGCTIGDKTFSHFLYGPSSLNTPVLPATSITVVPVDIPSNPELDFNALWGALAGQHQDSVLRFRVTNTVGGDPMDDLTLVQGGSVVSGTGVASVGETACIGDLFSNACASGSVVSLQTFFTGGSGPLVDHITFAPVDVVDVIKDISVYGGVAGFAFLSHVENQFSELPSGSEVPEPATVLLMSLGLAGIAGMRRYMRT